MHPLVLWDIDGTLLRGDRTVTGLFLQALREVYAIEGDVQKIDYGGKTDGQIVLETLALHEIEEGVAIERLPRFNRRYHALMDAMAHELHARLHLLPGVVQVMERLRQQNAIQTVLTGNGEPTAAIKLRAHGLDRVLDLHIGAYGSDHRDRDELVPIARRKAEAKHGSVGPAIVIGDTPRDIACGKAGNARTVAVATGRWSAEQLREHAPDALLPDLSDIDAAVAAILDPRMRVPSGQMGANKADGDLT